MYRMASVDGEFADIEKHAYTKMCVEFAIAPNDAELMTFITMGDVIPLQILRNAGTTCAIERTGGIIMMMVDHKIEDAELTLIGETAFKIGMSRERVREISDQVMEMYAQSCQ